MPKQGKTTKSIQISSNFTLFFKIVFPIFWVVFFGIFLIAALRTDMYTSFPTNKSTFRILAILFFITGVLFLYFTFWKLKRVEFFPDGMYVTDYFTHYKYGYKMIESTSYIHLLLFRIMVIKLTQKGHFGKTIPLIISRKRHQLFREMFPKMADSLGMK